MKTQERILMHEDTKAINQAQVSAELRTQKLNSISKVFSFESENEFKSRTRNIDQMVFNAMLKRPELKKLSESIELSSLRVPADIKEAQEVLLSLMSTENLFTHIHHNGNQWEVDSIAFEQFAESQRVYATGEAQIKKYEAATNLCKFLNDGKFGFGPYQAYDYGNVMIRFSLPYNWTVNHWWVVKD